MTAIIEKDRIGSLLKYEIDKNYCREVVTIAAGQNLPMGTVLGISANGKYTAAITNTNTSDVNAEGTLAVTGNLSITGGTVTITGGTSETTSESDVETTTITGGSISVTGGTASIANAVLAIDDGSLNINGERVFAKAVLLEDCDASLADKKALAVVRAAIVAEDALVFPAAASEDDKLQYKKDLARCGIVCRTTA